MQVSRQLARAVCMVQNMPLCMFAVLRFLMGVCRTPASLDMYMPCCGAPSVGAANQCLLWTFLLTLSLPPGLFATCVEGGSVRVGGLDVRQLQLDSLRRTMGEVPQVIDRISLLCCAWAVSCVLHSLVPAKLFFFNQVPHPPLSVLSLIL